jgi:hypothetical protein
MLHQPVLSSLQRLHSKIKERYFKPGSRTNCLLFHEFSMEHLLFQIQKLLKIYFPNVVSNYRYLQHSKFEIETRIITPCWDFYFWRVDPVFLRIHNCDEWIRLLWIQLVSLLVCSCISHFYLFNFLSTRGNRSPSTIVTRYQFTVFNTWVHNFGKYEPYYNY